MSGIKIFFRFWRFYFLFLFFLFIGATLLVRLFFLQVESRGLYRALAQGQHNFFKTLNPTRGEIFFHERQAGGGEKLISAARNAITKSAIVSPREIVNPSAAAPVISSILGLDEEHTAMVLSEDSSYAILKNGLTREEDIALQGAHITGLYFKTEQKREYPENERGAHVLGFVGKGEEDGRGQYGVEEFYNEELSGKNRIQAGGGRDDKSKGFLFFGDSSKLVPQKGADLYLTIDYNIQYTAERLLEREIKTHSAEGGQIIVMDPATGRIFAHAISPSFDPNLYAAVQDLKTFLNPLTQKQFEPGSVFKPFIVAAALELGKVTPETTFYDKGYVKIGPEIIKNFEDKVHNEQTVRGILEKSINTGMVFISQLLEKKDMKRFIREFGFGEKAHIDLPGEIGGDLSNLDDPRDIHYATASFGQGIAVTPIQLICAFSSFANGGKRITPFVVEKKVFADGREESHASSAKDGEKIISEKIAKEVTDMLVSVIENGTGKRARMEGYLVAGKTGTAQVPKLNGRGYGEETIHTFVGYVPASNPRFIILVKIDNPIGVRAAEGSAVPVFKELAQYMVNYLEIPPDVPILPER